MMYYGDHHPGVGGWVVMTLLMVLFWGGLILAGYALVRAAIGHQRPRGGARQLLDESHP